MILKKLKLGLLLIGIIFLSACQYKNPGVFLGEIYPANWRYELMPSISKCDECKLQFIEDYLNTYPNIDSLLVNKNCYTISSEVIDKIRKSLKKESSAHCVSQLKNNYKLIVNYKNVGERLATGNSICHDIRVVKKGYNGDSRTVLMEFYWQYNENTDRWELIDFFIGYSL